MHDGLRLLISAEYGNGFHLNVWVKNWTRESIAWAGPEEGGKAATGRPELTLQASPCAQANPALKWMCQSLADTGFRLLSFFCSAPRSERHFRARTVRS